MIISLLNLVNKKHLCKENVQTPKLCKLCALWVWDWPHLLVGITVRFCLYLYIALYLAIKKSLVLKGYVL